MDEKADSQGGKNKYREMIGDTDMNSSVKIFGVFFLAFFSPHLFATLSQSSISFSAAAGTRTVDITYKKFANDGNSYAPNLPYWLSWGESELLNDAGTTWTMRQSLTALRNPTLASRSCNLNLYTNMGTVSSGSSAVTYETLSVRQSAGQLYFGTSDLNCWLNQSRRHLQIYASSAIRWKVASNAAWISLTGTTSGRSSESISATIAKNTSGMRREGKIFLYLGHIKDSSVGHYSQNPSLYDGDDWVVDKWSSVASATIVQEGCLTYSGGENSVRGAVTIDYSNLDGEDFVFTANGTTIVSTTMPGTFVWQPTKTGSYSVTCKKGSETWTSTLKVTSLTAYTYPVPNPPDAQNSRISITPTTRNFDVDGGGNAIITQGSGTWTASKSEDWITLNVTSGTVGYPVAYTVSATTNVEQRVGYIYVSGWTHTVTQDGVGGTISPESREFESMGGSGRISVSTQDKMLWHAKSNVDWISVSATSGLGSGSVTYQVAPYNEVSTRQGTLTVAGNTFTVFQYGSRMKLDSYSTTQNYETHPIPITVNALAITEWSVTPNNSWISVVDAGNGHGGDLVTIAISENPSYNARTGTVSIGTETFTVTQQGRPQSALSFSISPAYSTASVEGANGIIAVTATPDLPWTATSGANWVSLYPASRSGAGNGNVVYSVSPNPTLSQRTGNITIWPGKGAAQTHTVTQPAATASISSSGYEFEAAGESCSIEVSLASIVTWSISESLDWLTVNGSLSRTGPGTVTLQASANETIYPRSGTVTIAGKTFSVSQKARGVEVEYDTKLFGTDGGNESISIHPDGNVSWTATSSDPTWITIFQGDSGVGDGEILYIVSPYVGDGTARIGWITVGDKKVYITQRAYDLSISPNGSYVTGNNGIGEFGVSASIGDVWTAIVTEPWITLISGYDSGTGSGTVRFIYAENATGKTRTGKIVINGEVYTLEQRARQMVAITAAAEHGGHVSGGGSYDVGSQVTLTAVPDAGYNFSYWTGAVSSMQNPLKITVDAPASYTAVFEPQPLAIESVRSSTAGVTLTWNNLAWAATYTIYRGITSVPSSATVLAELQNDGSCTYLDETGDVDVEYWYWVEAEGSSDDVMSDPMTGRKEKPIVYSAISYTNLRGATNPNPATYQEGTFVTFENLGAVTGYTFAGWTPAQITSDMTGAQTVRAEWTANSYSITYNPNGGSGTMDATAATYDSEVSIAENGFTWSGHEFTGWATNETGEAVYVAGQTATNLTAQSGGVVALYAVWELSEVAMPEITPAGGSTFSGVSQTVSITCATPGATIYYSTSGANPKETATYLYSGPFTITDTTTVKAKAVCGALKSDVVTAIITKVEAVPPAAPVISPDDGSSFAGDSCRVTISCSTPDAVIYYTTNGSNPKTTEANRYKGPFDIVATTTVKAVAKNAYDDLKSSVMTATITKTTLTFAQAVGADGLIFTSGGSDGVEWVVASDATSDGGVAVRSGEIGDGGSTWIETSVSGIGTFSFKWRADCEDDDTTPTSATWDHVRVETNGVEISRIDGSTGWIGPVSINISGGATVRWIYEKDESDAGGNDCAWIDSVVWTPSIVANVAVDGEKGEIAETADGYVVTAKEGKALTEADFVFGSVPKEAYKIEIAEGGKSATVTLAVPVVGVVPEEAADAQKDEDDPLGLLVEVASARISAKPEPKSGETVGALPIKAYKGLYYRAAWGGNLTDMTIGEKVRATGSTLYLGVIKQNGEKGFYKLTVSEK